MGYEKYKENNIWVLVGLKVKDRYSLIRVKLKAVIQRFDSFVTIKSL